MEFGVWSNQERSGTNMSRHFIPSVHTISYVLAEPNCYYGCDWNRLLFLYVLFIFNVRGPRFRLPGVLTDPHDSGKVAFGPSAKLSEESLPTPCLIEANGNLVSYISFQEKLAASRGGPVDC